VTFLANIAAAAEADRASILLATSRQANSNFTDSLKEADAARDAAFSSLRDFFATWAKSPMHLGSGRSHPRSAL